MACIRSHSDLGWSRVITCYPFPENLNFSVALLFCQPAHAQGSHDLFPDLSRLEAIKTTARRHCSFLKKDVIFRYGNDIHVFRSDKMQLVTT